MQRGWQDHPIFRREPFSRRDAFVWLVENAAFKPCRIPTTKGETTLERGQLSYSLRFMARAWRWDEARVRRFLQSLRNAQIIDAATDAGQTLLTICNYSRYQGEANGTDADADAEATRRRRGGDANKKEGEEGKKEEESPDGDSPSGDGPSLRPEHVFEGYQALATELGISVPRDFTPERRKLVKGRITQYSMDDFQTVFGKCRDSPFLRGDVKGRTPLAFDWLMKKGNFQKVLEGNYDR